jgi:MFS family permease
MLFGFGSISSSRVALSLYALDLGASASAVGVLMGSLYVFPLLASWPVGRYADRVGARWPLLIGAGCGGVAMLIPYFVRELAALYVAATLLGIAFTLFNVLLPNAVGLLSKPEERARNFSNASLVGATTLFAGPLLAGIAIDISGHAAAFLYLVALPVGAAAVLLRWGAMLPGGGHHTGSASGLRDTLADPALLRILATSSLVQVGQDLFQFYIPVYGHGIGLSASAIGGLLATLAAASFTVRFFLPRLVAQLGEEKVLALSFYVTATGFALVPFFENVVMLSLVSFLFGLGMGCGQPITTMLIFSRSTPGRSGETLGLRQSVNNAMRVSGPTLFGFVATAFGLPPVFWISALMMGSGGLLSRPRSKR